MKGYKANIQGMEKCIHSNEKVRDLFSQIGCTTRDAAVGFQKGAGSLGTYGLLWKQSYFLPHFCLWRSSLWTWFTQNKNRVQAVLLGLFLLPGNSGERGQDAYPAGIGMRSLTGKGHQRHLSGTSPKQEYSLIPDWDSLPKEPWTSIRRFSAGINNWHSAGRERALKAVSRRNLISCYKIK